MPPPFRPTVPDTKESLISVWWRQGLWWKRVTITFVLVSKRCVPLAINNVRLHRVK